MTENVIRIERVLSASPKRVFDAFADAKSLSVWMCPSDEISHATVEVDFRVGGRFRIAMHGGERDYVQHGEYLAIEPGRRIELRWVSEWMPPEHAVTRLVVSFEAVDGGTRLSLEHRDLPDGDAYQGHREGWQRILAALSQHLTVA
ncbi:MAG: SRPBCC domain-containing protein [Myxococcota bacterium]